VLIVEHDVDRVLGFSQRVTVMNQGEVLMTGSPAEVRADRRVQEIHQALSEPYFSKISAGMSRDDVYRMLGRPREIWLYPARDEEAWTWRYLDTNYMFFNVLFDRTAGTVRTTQRLQEIRFLDGNRGTH